VKQHKGFPGKFFPFLIFSFLVCFANSADAQKIYSKVSKKTVAVNEKFEVNFSYEYQGSSSVNFTPPDLDDFLIFSGPNQSRSISVTNNAATITGSYSYILSARKLGTYQIAGAKFTIEGVTHNIQPITIKVEGSSAQDESGDYANGRDIRNKLFIRAIVDKPTAYLGEQITVSYKIYVSPDVRPEYITHAKLPLYEGFWAEELEGSSNYLTPETYNGTQYNTAILKKAALFPTRSGSLKISPISLTLSVIFSGSSSNYDPFSSYHPGSSSSEEVKISSPVVNVNILPLPNGDTSKYFTGAVGKFSLETKVAKRKFKKNEPVKFQIILNGTGNIELLDVARPTFNKSFEVLDPNITKTKNNSGVISGSKVIEYVLIPRDGGKYSLPAVGFTWFDPQTKTYETLKTKELPITVINEKYNDGLTVETGEEIDIYKSASSFLEEQGTYPAGWFVVLSLFLPLVSAAYFVSYKRKEFARLNDPAYKIKTAAQKLAAEKMSKARLLLNEKNYDKFYSEAATALEGYLITRHGIQLSEMTSAKAEETLISAGKDPAFALEIKKLLDDCELMRFAPVSGKMERMQEVYDRASSIIERLESGEE